MAAILYWYFLLICFGRIANRANQSSFSFRCYLYSRYDEVLLGRSRIFAVLVKDTGNTVTLPSKQPDLEKCERPVTEPLELETENEVAQIMLSERRRQVSAAGVSFMIDLCCC